MSDQINLKEQIQNDMKAAMRAHEKQKLDVIRFLLAAIKRREVDEKITLNNEQVLSIIEKQTKQLKDALNQFEKAGRDDLAQKEAFGLKILQAYLPEQLSDQELDTIVKSAVAETKATSMRDMGQVMAAIKPKIQGRADMGKVSTMIKALLQG